jgi:hypothetical protein
MVTDYKLDNNADLVFENGDFAKVTDDQCNQQASILILNTNKGAWKFSPLCGVGIKQYQGSSGMGLIMKREIKIQHQMDGFNKCEVIQAGENNFDFYLNLERQENGN